MDLPNPGYDADMLRRAALACRNFQLQVKHGAGNNVDWFDWVPVHLDQLADRLDADQLAPR